MAAEEAPKATEDMTLDELREAYATSERQRWDLEMQLQCQLHNEARREREIAAAARRGAMENKVARQDFYLQHEVSKRLAPLDAVLYRIEQLGERASAKQVAALKQAATDARHMLEFRKGGKPDTRLADIAEAEADRLRTYIVEQGRALHRLLAPERTMCTCQGCDLIRGMDMDVTPLPVAVGS